jgi:hypothetical protein
MEGIMQKIKFVAIVLFLALSCLPRAGVAATEQGLDEIRALTSAVERLADQMKAQNSDDLELRKLEIAIAYLNFRSRRIEMFERDLQGARTKRKLMDDILDKLQREEDSLPSGFAPGQKEVREKALKSLDLRRKAVFDRIERIDEEIIMLENRVGEMQSQLDDIEDFVRKHLNF